MGLFDYVYISDHRTVCSEGHNLCHLEFQTKDLGCTMGDAQIKDGKLIVAGGGYGDRPRLPFLGRISIYTTCLLCPAFVQATTGNLCGAWVEFELEIVDNAVRSVTRTSPSTAEWLMLEPQQEWMAGCHGPMPYEDAVTLHLDIARKRLV